MLWILSIMSFWYNRWMTDTYSRGTLQFRGKALFRCYSTDIQLLLSCIRRLLNWYSTITQLIFKYLITITQMYWIVTQMIFNYLINNTRMYSTVTQLLLNYHSIITPLLLLLEFTIFLRPQSIYGGWIYSRI